MATEKRLIERIADRLKDAYPQADRNNLCPAIYYDDFAEIVDDVLSEFEEAVDAVEVVHGRWVLMVHEEQCNFRWNVTAECSECQHSKGEIYAGHFSGFPKDIVESLLPIYAKKVKLDNYCPNCGANMDGDGNG